MAETMTKFQKWVIALFIVFGLVLLYFWRVDVTYNRCVKAETSGIGRLSKANTYNELKACQKASFNPFRW